MCTCIIYTYNVSDTKLFFYHLNRGKKIRNTQTACLANESSKCQKSYESTKKCVTRRAKPIWLLPLLLAELLVTKAKNLNLNTAIFFVLRLYIESEKINRPKRNWLRNVVMLEFVIFFFIKHSFQFDCSMTNAIFFCL